MTTITELNKINEILKKYEGGYAKIWAFKLSLNRLFIRLTLIGYEEVVYIVAVSCEHMIGPFSWKNAKLSIVKETDKENSEVIFYAIDIEAGFKLTASGGLILACGSEKEFEDYFAQQ